MTRYHHYDYLAKGFLISKSSFYSFKNIPRLASISLEAGHFKLTSIYPEHGLIFSALAGQPPTVKMFTHGKRKRPTVLLTANICGGNISPVVDKFINVLLPNIEDFRPLRLRKSFWQDGTYTWRLRRYFDWVEVAGLISDRLLKKDVFLPLFLHVSLRPSISHQVNESYLRMLRLPISLSKKA